MTERPGIIRYTLTKHFQDAGIIPQFWFCAINPVLERAVAKATGEIRLPSKESSMEYLERYFREQELRELNPAEDVREYEPPKYRKDYRPIDWELELYLQKHEPTNSMRWRVLRDKVLTKLGHKCARCGSDGPILAVDHIKPRSKYPKLVWREDNLQVLCRPCNSFKSNRLATDYRQGHLSC